MRWPNSLPRETFQVTPRGGTSQTDHGSICKLRRQSTWFWEATVARICWAEDCRAGSCMDNRNTRDLHWVPWVLNYTYVWGHYWDGRNNHRQRSDTVTGVHAEEWIQYVSASQSSETSSHTGHHAVLRKALIASVVGLKKL